MTMTRNTKRDHGTELGDRLDGKRYVFVQFASPRLRTEALADRGHCYMTPAEYRTHRMGRCALNAEMAAERRVQLAELHRKQRVTSARLLAGPGRRRARVERRITGLTPGTKRPATWRGYAVEREITPR